MFYETSTMKIKTPRVTINYKSFDKAEIKTKIKLACWCILKCGCHGT